MIKKIFKSPLALGFVALVLSAVPAFAATSVTLSGGSVVDYTNVLSDIGLIITVLLAVSLARWAGRKIVGMFR